MDPHVRQIDIHFINWNAQNPVLIDRIEIIKYVEDIIRQSNPKSI